MPAEYLPLLVFPERRILQPEKGNGFPPGKQSLPGHGAQVVRIGRQIEQVEQDFARYQASLTGVLAGLEPEMVLVIEIVGRLDDFRQAVEAAGLEWLGETELDDLEAEDDSFYEADVVGQRVVKPLSGRMFLAMSNMTGMREILSLWEQWKENRDLAHGKTKWKAVFEQLNMLRRWGIEEALVETGMIDRWQDLLDPITPDQTITFQIELFYRRSDQNRSANEAVIRSLLESLGGRAISEFIDMPQIAFHAVKAELPARAIQSLLDQVAVGGADTDIELFKFAGIMYFRPTGQSLAVSEEGEGEPAIFPQGVSDLPPVAALLDGAPLQLHEALKDRLLVDDVFGLEATYQPGERKHGTAMASLILHGDRSNPETEPLGRKLYCVPVMQPDHQTRENDEHMPDDVFFEDRIHIAVRRMFEGAGDVPPQAPTVKVINISLGDTAREFIHTPSPWARLLDWLAYRYRVLFCVSAGNYCEGIDLGLNQQQFAALSDGDKIRATIKAVSRNLSSRRLLSPAEAINAITVGAAHTDDSGEAYAQFGQRVDVLPSQALFSPATRLGFGFRRSIKPDIFMPGGRQLYSAPLLAASTLYSIDNSVVAPGQKVALDSRQQGVLNHEVFWRGTSNATALATRGVVRLYDMLDKLRAEEGEDIPEALMSVLLKALLVHGAKQDDESKKHIEQAVKDARNSRQFKQVTARYLGYGAVDIERVLTCTAQRATVLGCGEIRENEVHEYAFPIPPGFSSQKIWRRLVVTLAWLTPINPDHRNLREAKLMLEPGGGNWSSQVLKLDRQDGDHNQVERGTVQHEVLEGKKQIQAFEDGEALRIRVSCKKDATAYLDAVIPYGLAVTLEAKEDIPIYQQVRARIKQPVRIAPGIGR
ncbi:Exopolyphosphatase [Xanthomonas citri pv. fuscans]|uniref:Exopolyphosphatase n=3 Tax=Xanthomonas TaxID=338 RepID=A0AB34QL30_XANCH|nr:MULTISPECIES: S8 family peptidase [Xanthomonas]ATS51877.1 S8 family peptidase [Xanthomonas citri pv. phaseoli var. fuscans]KHS36984.1 exopolyphosphatase [Xanthomonas phaseoli pv. phaseoli]SOO20334.1 Exopolyphosphatase [Xanthomonas citri pv. fuscans]